MTRTLRASNDTCVLRSIVCTPASDALRFYRGVLIVCCACWQELECEEERDAAVGYLCRADRHISVLQATIIRHEKTITRLEGRVKELEAAAPIDPFPVTSSSV